MKSGFEDDDVARFFLGLSGAALGFLAGLFSGVHVLTNVSNAFIWVGMSRPEVYLAAKALNML